MLAVLVAIFIVGAITSSIAQRNFFAAVSRLEPDVLSDAEVARRIQDRPARLFDVVPMQTKRRLQSLFRRNSDREVERKRVIALLAISVCLVGFLGIGLSVLGVVAT